MNLVINAGEAIGEKEGRAGFSITTGIRDLAESLVDAVGEQVGPGRYVYAEIGDTGSGIEEQRRSSIFDPFFTTKFTGRGLGLAAVAGIVRSLKGAILVESAPGPRQHVPRAPSGGRGQGEAACARKPVCARARARSWWSMTSLRCGTSLARCFGGRDTAF